MATNTTNFGLKKPAYSDTADIADINGNMDKVDVSLNGLADAIAIVANNNTHAAITAGQFVYVHGHGSLAEGLYTAKSNIAANAALSTSNLQADGSGGLNALNSKIEDFYPSETFSGDLNNLATGQWYCDGSCSNLPVANAYFFVQCMIRSANIGEQFAYKSNEDRVFFRRKREGTWNNWQELALNSKLSTTSPTVTKTANIKTNSVVSAKRNANVVSIYMDVYAASTSSDYVSIASLSEAPSTNVYFVMTDVNDNAKMCRLTSGGVLQIHGTVADRNYMGSLTYIVNS
jgi:hypothetical protein